MRLKEEPLRHLCARYRVDGPDADDIVERFLSQYASTELRCNHTTFADNSRGLAFFARSPEGESVKPVLDGILARHTCRSAGSF